MLTQAHRLAVKLQAGKRTGKAARKEARVANRATAAEQREAAAASAPADEVLLCPDFHVTAPGKQDFSPAVCLQEGMGTIVQQATGFTAAQAMAGTGMAATAQCGLSHC